MANVLDAQYTTQNDVWGLKDASSHTKLAMSFKPTKSANVTQIILRLRRFLSGVGNLTVDIYNDSAGLPGSVIAASSNTIDASTIPTTAGGTAETFTVSSTRIVANTQYWIVLSTTSAVDASNFTAWSEDNAAGYAGGSPAAYNGSAWSGIAGDFWFQEYYDDTTLNVGAFLLHFL